MLRLRRCKGDRDPEAISAIEWSPVFEKDSAHNPENLNESIS